MNDDVNNTHSRHCTRTQEVTYEVFHFHFHSHLHSHLHSFFIRVRSKFLMPVCIVNYEQ